MQVTPNDVASHALRLSKYSPPIPYVANGQDPHNPQKGMDCQGLVEVCIALAGGKAAYSGSNAMFRASASNGTLWTYDAKTLKPGMCVYMLEQNGGEQDKYKADGLGNCSHVGLAVCQSATVWTVDASASAGHVRMRTKRDAPHVWTHQGWLPEVSQDAPNAAADTQYVVSQQPQVVLGDGYEELEPTPAPVLSAANDEPIVAAPAPPSSDTVPANDEFEALVKVSSVNLRKLPDINSPVRNRAMYGDRIYIRRVESHGGRAWGLTSTIGTDGSVLSCWVDTQFLQRVVPPEPVQPEPAQNRHI